MRKEVKRQRKNAQTDQVNAVYTYCIAVLRGVRMKLKTERMH